MTSFSVPSIKSEVQTETGETQVYFKAVAIVGDFNGNVGLGVNVALKPTRLVIMNSDHMNKNFAEIYTSMSYSIDLDASLVRPKVRSPLQTTTSSPSDEATGEFKSTGSLTRSFARYKARRDRFLQFEIIMK